MSALLYYTGCFFPIVAGDSGKTQPSEVLARCRYSCARQVAFVRVGVLEQ